MLKSILVPVRGDGMVGTVLAHAAEVAKRHSAHVSVVHCRVRPKDLIPQGIAMPEFARSAAMKQASELANHQEDHLRRILHRLARDFGLEQGDPKDGVATCTFSEEHGKMSELTRHIGRLSDLIVLPKPQRETNLGQSTLKSALYGAGRPVLMCPGQLQPDASFGDNVAIGWNGSLPASRAVTMTQDIVRAARKVTILSGGKGQSHGPTTDELVAYYAARGITATTVHFESKSPAKALLEHAKKIGASMLVTGAYSHSHESEMLFGGNTQKLVDETEMPILMAH